MCPSCRSRSFSSGRTTCRLAAVESSDFVLLVDRPLQEFTAATFGAGYLDRVAAWVGANYRPAGRPRARSAMVLLRRSHAGPIAAPPRSDDAR